MNTDCSVYKTMDFVGKKWTVLILLEIYKGNNSKRYSEIKKSLPNITPKILSARLKELEQENVITKVIDTSQFPISTEYFLTESGKDFVNIVKSIKFWTLKWNSENRICNNQDCSSCKF